MSNSYPQVRNAIKVNPTVPTECAACDKPAIGYVRIAWDYMRGNDDSEAVCQRHMDMANGNLNRFFAHCRTKKTFVSKERQP